MQRIGLSNKGRHLLQCCLYYFSMYFSAMYTRDNFHIKEPLPYKRARGSYFILHYSVYYHSDVQNSRNALKAVYLKTIKNYIMCMSAKWFPFFSHQREFLKYHFELFILSRLQSSQRLLAGLYFLKFLLVTLHCHRF